MKCQHALTQRRMAALPANWPPDYNRDTATGLASTGRTRVPVTHVVRPWNVDGRLRFKVCHPRQSPATRGRIVEQVICTCPQPDWLWDRFYGRPYHLGSHRNGPGAAAIRTWANVLEWRMKTGEHPRSLSRRWCSGRVCSELHEFSVGA